MAKKAGGSKRPGRPGRGSDQFIVRLPDGMRERIADIAADSGRSMNAVVVEALVLHLDHVGNDAALQELWDKVERLESKVEQLDAQINPRLDD
jgi:predicted DNA-binding protein